MNLKLDILKETCPCGKSHRLDLKNMMIRSGAIDELIYELLSGNLRRFQKPVILCDRNTWEAIDGKLSVLASRVYRIELNPEDLHADTCAVSQALSHWHYNTDLILAVGTGTIHDISRYLSYTKKIPFVSVPTAASADGFASNVASFGFDHMKKTIPSTAPIAIYADTEIFAEAPYRLTASGIADVLGKYIALCDWRISNILTGEYLCERIYSMELQAIEDVKATIPGLKKGNYDAYEKLMYALLLSGLAMQIVGNSRPSSGAEHHIAHYFEMELTNPPLSALHGERISVGLILALTEYKLLAERIDQGMIKLHTYKEMPKSLRKLFSDTGLILDIVIENTPEPLDSVPKKMLQNKLNELSNYLHALPEPAEIKCLLQEAGCPVSTSDLGLIDYDDELCLLASPYTRNRLTMMRLRWLL